MPPGPARRARGGVLRFHPTAGAAGLSAIPRRCRHRPLLWEWPFGGVLAEDRKKVKSR